MSTREAFFEDMASQLDYWVNAATASLLDVKHDLCWTDNPPLFQRLGEAIRDSGIAQDQVRLVLGEILRGLAVSWLTIIDGGTKLAETERIALVDEMGEPLGEALHCEFLSYLIKTGRMQ